jgi:two-component system phosphate regulon response regulator OmpR
MRSLRNILLRLGSAISAHNEFMSSTPGPLLLLVDDDLRFRSLLATWLERDGFAVAVAGNAEHMNRALNEQAIDLMVLDITLPQANGLNICRDLRAQGSTLPIIMLTAKGDDIDRILGLEIGADDYLGKPCNPRELAARIRAVLRRRESRPAGAPSAQPVEISFGPFCLRPATRQLERDGKPVELTTGEFAVLYALVSHPRQTLSRERLVSLARGRQRGAFDRSIDIQMSRLRRLIENDSSKPRYLQTVWGAGYVFVPDDSQ